MDSQSKDTKPKLLLRSILHRIGYRFTLNGTRNKQLPGKPDIVLPKWNTVIFVHHNNQRPNPGATAELTNLGWNVIAISESELSNPEKTQQLTIRLPNLIEQKPMDIQATTNTCNMDMVAEKEGWFRE